jgi:tRNA(Ile)-lysidine synthase
MSTMIACRRHPLLDQVTAYLQRHDLIMADRGVLLAVSGGADSVCLLAVLEELQRTNIIPGLRLHMAHMNYGLRDVESDADETFVRELGKRFGLPVSCARVGMADWGPGNRQRQARTLRYDFFESLCREHKLDVIATGHSADDQAETLLLWLLRGSGLRGLTGIPAARDGRVIRPLLSAHRSDILNYLEHRHLRFRVDSSNATPAYRRNRIRHELLPQLQQFNPRVAATLARTADMLTQEAAILDAVEDMYWQRVLAENSAGAIALDCDQFQPLSLGMKRRLIQRAWREASGIHSSLSFHHVSLILERAGTEEAVVSLPRGMEVRRRGERLVIQHQLQVARPSANWPQGLVLGVPGETRLSDGRRIVVSASHTARSGVAPDPNSFACDADLIGSALQVRSWRAGDWFCPVGMNGHRKKLQDFFMDQKLPRRARYEVPIVVGPSGIVWVAGYRGDERFRPCARTSRVMTLTLKDAL